MRCARRDAASTSSAAIRTTARCRWTISCGSRSGADRTSSSTPVAHGGGGGAAQAHTSALPHRCAAAGRRAGGDGARRHPDALLHYDTSATSTASEGDLPPAGAGADLRHRALHAPQEAGALLRGGGRGAASCGSTMRSACLHDGVVELAPGITLHPTGGHSAGLQFVRVHTRRGWVVLASDVTHFYENLETQRPFHHRVSRRRDAGRLRSPAGCRAQPPTTSCRGTIRWSCSAIPRRIRSWPASSRGWTSRQPAPG